MLLGFVCIGLVIAICVQIKTISFVNNSVSSTYAEDQLRDEVLKWKENYDRKNEELKQAEKQLETVRNKAAENDTGAAQMTERLSLANRLLGLTAVKGKGIKITLDDNKAQASNAQDGDQWIYLVHDDDIEEIINDLKNGGAEAIAVNQQRIISTTGIMCDGNVVRINGEKVSAPYVISAIGSPEGLLGSIDFPGAYLESLQAAGVVKSIEKSNEIEIPKYEGVISSEYIRNYQ